MLVKSIQAHKNSLKQWPTVRDTSKVMGSVLLWALAGVACAEENASPAAAVQTQASSPAAPPSIWDRATLFGDMGGLRSHLDTYGISIGLQETSEYLANLSGGIKRGGAYDGLTQLKIGVDTQKALGLPGGLFNISALQIHGRSFNDNYQSALQGGSGINALSTTRLWELWYQQTLLDGKLDVKVGQQSIDQEFMLSQYGASMMNLTFGWPALPSENLPGGGPAYPLSSLGVRIRAKPSKNWAVLAGVFDGSPGGNTGARDQTVNRHGTTFNVKGGALLIGELQYFLNPTSDSASADTPGDNQTGGLPGTYKLGFWYNTQRFADSRFDTSGLSLANPASKGVAREYRGDYSFYAYADQMIWRPSADSPRSIGVFINAMGAPGDRNLISLGINAGIALKAPFKGRDNDVAALAIGYAKIGAHASDLANDTAAFVPGTYSSRTAETVLEATYQYQIAPWWMLQGDAQYVFRPSGGIAAPSNPSRRIGNETIVGLRTTITF